MIKKNTNTSSLNYLKFLRDAPDRKVFVRVSFEKLIREITHCTTGDGTLEIDSNYQYKNPHVQYMWERFNRKT